MRVCWIHDHDHPPATANVSAVTVSTRCCTASTPIDSDFFAARGAGVLGACSRPSVGGSTTAWPPPASPPRCWRWRPAARSDSGAADTATVVPASSLVDHGERCRRVCRSCCGSAITPSPRPWPTPRRRDEFAANAAADPASDATRGGRRRPGGFPHPLQVDSGTRADDARAGGIYYWPDTAALAVYYDDLGQSVPAAGAGPPRRGRHRAGRSSPTRAASSPSGSTASAETGA